MGGALTGCMGGEMGTGAGSGAALLNFENQRITVMIRQAHMQGLRQEQVLTRKQIQALEILAAPICELQPLVTAEVARNPLLEVEEADVDHRLPDEASPMAADTGDDDSWIEALLRIDEESVSFERRLAPVSPEEERRRQHLLASITVPRTLGDDLNEQLHFLDLDPATRAACEMIVAAVDLHGYCSAHPADLAMVSGRSLAAMEQALRIVQSLEPPGIAARDLRDRLLLQMDRKGLADCFAYRVIRDHFDDVAHNRLPSLARKLRVRLGELREVLDTVRLLEPVPGPRDSQPDPDYVEAEVTVSVREGRLDVRVDDGDLPRLRINRQYKRLLRDPSVPTDTKEYIRGKLRAAAQLIHSLSQRQRTLNRIAAAVAELQEDFFLHGREHLRPMTMATIAQRIGVHETTVSRAVAGKYLRCPSGTLPIRQLFTSGCQDDHGQVVSSSVIKNHIQRLIDDEDPAHPLSDSRIALSLQNQGLRVARRTVAKYRESLQILPCGRRRRYLP
jgi:RNA polymerase sigma-54 factor